jgi:hypothetical protein
MSSPRPTRQQASPDQVVRRRRDAALGRARSITKTVAVASVAAVAAFGIYISRALPGHAATSHTSSGSTVSPSDGSTSAGSDSGGGQSPSDLAPPNSPPAQSQQSAPVVSGSS